MADDIQQLKQAIAANDIIVVVGPDVSIYTTNGKSNASFWQRWFNQGLERCRQLGSISDAHCQVLRQMLEKHTVEVTDYALVADRIKCCLNGNADAYQSWLTDTIVQFSSHKPELINTIGGMHCPILTTNYDSLLEQTLHREPLILGKHRSEKAMKKVKQCILHTHGCYKDPRSVVFTSEDYNQLAKNESAQSQMRALVQNKTLLLVGYGSTACDPNLSHLLQWIFSITSRNPPTIYKLVQSHARCSALDNTKNIPYGETFEDLLAFVTNLQFFSTFIRESYSSATRRENVREKYLNYLIEEYSHVSIFGYSTNDMSLPLESVYVELKFDPTHPSIRAMKSVDISEEFQRRVSSYHFFDDNEKGKLIQAIVERHVSNPQTIYRDLMVDQWLNVLLSNRKIFSEGEATAIKRKVSELKRSIFEKNNVTEARQYQIRQAYREFKHFLILGHPGAGKTTLAKWLVMNMAQQCLGRRNMLFASTCTSREKIPILIPIWKYVDQTKAEAREQRSTLLEFLHEHAMLDSTRFTNEERADLSALIKASLMQGNVLVVFEGLDEVPVHVDRADLVKDINSLLERGIDYDPVSDKLIHSPHEHKEINNTRDPTSGNRFIITSRIEGNYFEEINFYIPRLTIQDMSNEALRLFCNSYTQCIKPGSRADQLYNEITLNKDIFQLAINPQLASVIAAVYHQYEDRLPEKRIDLYEQAIERMIQRLVSSSVNDGLRLTTTMLWSILQNIAEYLHNRVEGLSESSLRAIIRLSLNSDQQDSSTNIDGLIGQLVDIFKYKVGLLNEFGYNSFRFIHRTFQEYLAAKSLIYVNGSQRSADAIYANIINNIAIPNWRVPLSMTFGILSQLPEQNGLCEDILARLLTHQLDASSEQFSTLLVPFVLIDSLTDMHFTRPEQENQLVHKLADLLLLDYKNLSAFARLPEHQKLIHSYFSKLGKKCSLTLIAWFIEKIGKDENIAPCANILHELKWFDCQFHQLFLANLQHDSHVWNWPVDSLLRSYSMNTSDAALHFKRTLIARPELTEYIRKDMDWLAVITVLYGGYANYRSPASITEYYETAQFLNLSSNERMPFIFYYRDIWGRDDPAYNMAVHLDNFKAKDNWDKTPSFDPKEIYKESSFTSHILQLLSAKRPAGDLTEHLRQQISSATFDPHRKAEAAVALVALGDVDFVVASRTENEAVFDKSLTDRLEQLTSVLQDPIARCSCQIDQYLLFICKDMMKTPSSYNLNISNYCRTYLSLVATSGGQPVDTKALAEAMINADSKFDLYAEHLALKLTGGSTNDMRYTAAVLLDQCITSMTGDSIVRSFLRMSEAVQLYKPLRGYPWQMDQFLFKSFPLDDLPIAFFNCLENIHVDIAFTIQAVCEVAIKDGYFTRNADLIPLVVLLLFGTTSKDVEKSAIYENLLPELAEVTHIKQFFLDRIQTMLNPYYKSRALYQLAQFYDERSLPLLHEAFQLTKQIAEATLRFQVLEKIYSVLHYKAVHQRLFIEQVAAELVATFHQMTDLNDRVIASIRLSFYGSSQWRQTYLTHALEFLAQMDEDNDKIRLMIKLKPLVSIDCNLRTKLDAMTRDLNSETNRHLVHAHYGKILGVRKTPTHELADLSNYTELETLFRLVAQLNDAKLFTGQDESPHQLWTNLYLDVHNQSNKETILRSAFTNEIFLTPHVAAVIDELIQLGEEDAIAILFPYIIKPSNEVLPTVYRWFTMSGNSAVKKLAALLLAEAKYIFQGALETLLDLLLDNNDQMRYRAQRLFQHPERDPQKPSKAISVLGENTLLPILRTVRSREHCLRVRVYLRTFFHDLLWDDPHVLTSLHASITQLQEASPSDGNIVWYFDQMKFIDRHTWSCIMELLQSPVHPLCIEEILISVMRFALSAQITEEDWLEFARVLALADTRAFRERLYFVRRDIEVIGLILDEICASTTLSDESYFANLESKIISEVTVPVEDLCRSNYERIKHICSCTFHVSSSDFNQQILNLLNNMSITIRTIESLLRWSMQQMMNFKSHGNSMYSLIMCDHLLSLVAACVQKEDYLYRKVTNAAKFDQTKLIELLSKIIHHHPYYPARGSAFVLLTALDLPDHQIVLNALATMFDENVVKEYTTIGIPLIHLSPNRLVDHLLHSLADESAIKIHEVLKIVTQFALDEKIDADCKAQIINYLAKEIGQFKSKKLVNYYYTDIKIPFTTTLENDLYQAWIKIQGLAGKTQYAITDHQ